MKDGINNIIYIKKIDNRKSFLITRMGREVDGEGTEYVEILIVGHNYLSYLKAITLDNRKSFNRCLKRVYDTWMLIF